MLTLRSGRHLWLTSPDVTWPGGRGEPGQRGDLRGQTGHRRGSPSARRGKGGLAARLEEIAAAEVGRLAGLAAGLLGSGAGLGVLEQAMRAALTSSGARLLEAVLAGDGDGYAGPHAQCPDGHQAAYAGRRDKTITTVLGPVRIARAWYHCAGCKHGFAPRDRQLGVAGAAESPGLSEMMALAGSEASFARAAGLMAGLAGITVSPRTIERSAEATGANARAASQAEAAGLVARVIVPLPPAGPLPDMLYAEVDGTGVPVRPSETEDRAGRDGDRAGTREVKLARLFTVSRLDDEGRPVMDPDSSTYTATFAGKNALERLVEAEYLRRGGEHFRQVVALGDGAAWIWTMAEKLYPHATHIVDIYHAREHLTDLASHLDKKLGYFERNAHRMHYERFQKLGMFIGSGAIEGGIKAIVVQRAKQAGMHWTVEGAENIIHLRCQRASGRWDEMWPARPDPLLLAV